MGSLRYTRHIFFILALVCSLTAWQSVAYAEDNGETADAAVSTVNINSAGVEEISSTLIGVGPSRAAAIVAYREQNGRFESLADLQEVKGIGDTLAEKNVSRITF